VEQLAAVEREPGGFLREGRRLKGNASAAGKKGPLRNPAAGRRGPRGRVRIEVAQRTDGLPGEKGVATVSEIRPQAGPTIYGPEPIEWEGRRGARYWVHHPLDFSGQADVDERLAGYPVAVFQPPGRPAHETPVVIALQGMAAPYSWSAFILPTLLERGIACAMFEAPAAGERSLVRAFDGDVLTELQGFADRGVPVTTRLVVGLFNAVTRDYATVLRLLEERHGLTDPRRAMCGVSLGVLLSAYVFLKDGVGERLLGAIGHADLARFARSYAPWFRPVAPFLPVDVLGGLAALFAGPRLHVGLAFLKVLHELAADRGPLRGINPMTYADRAGPGRRVRFLVGADAPLVRTEDAQACPARFPDGACYVVPGLGHGGDALAGHVQYFLATQLGDWAW
jgi:hypothetical protein